MIKYYEEFHAKSPDVIILFWINGKYYTYKETAKIVKQYVGKLAKFDGNETAIKSSDIYPCISKLIRAGKKVALCEKM